MWGRANRAKMGWQRDINHETARRRMDETGNAPTLRSPIRSLSGILRLEFCKLLFGAIDIGFSRDAEFKKLLLAA
jgi:hypothetical protein